MIRSIVFVMLLAASMPLAAQKNNPIQTPYGNQFVNHTKKGGVVPAAGDNVLVHIDTWVGDSLMQSTRTTSPNGRTISLPPTEQLQASSRIPAFVDASIRMGVGDSATIYMPLDSFLLTMLPKKLRSEKFMRYEIRLLNIQPASEVNKIKEKTKILQQTRSEQMQKTLADYHDKKLASRLVRSTSGLQILIEQQGNGAPVKEGELVRVHYIGCLSDGRQFDSSYQRGEPIEFPVGIGQMIAGFDEGVRALRHGGKAFLFIPPALGYGSQEAGSIPANSELIFYIEVL
jgi:FKBP-type peptidyl-prolyl cis-trans isomerase